MRNRKDEEDGRQEEIREPLIRVANENGHGSESVHPSNGHPWMVYLSTFVAVCGSYEFGACVST